MVAIELPEVVAAFDGAPLPASVTGAADHAVVVKKTATKVAAIRVMFII
jgi:hypothetical protein